MICYLLLLYLLFINCCCFCCSVRCEGCCCCFWDVTIVCCCCPMRSDYCVVLIVYLWDLMNVWCFCCFCPIRCYYCVLLLSYEIWWLCIVVVVLWDLMIVMLLLSRRRRWGMWSRRPWPVNSSRTSRRSKRRPRSWRRRSTRRSRSSRRTSSGGGERFNGDAEILVLKVHQDFIYDEQWTHLPWIINVLISDSHDSDGALRLVYMRDLIGVMVLTMCQDLLIFDKHSVLLSRIIFFNIYD